MNSNPQTNRKINSNFAGRIFFFFFFSSPKFLRSDADVISLSCSFHELGRRGMRGRISRIGIIFVPSLSLTLLRHLLKKDNGTDDAVSGHGHVSASSLRVRIELDGPSFKLDSGRSNVATSHFFVNKSRSEPRGRSLSNEKWFQDDLALIK